MRLHTMTDRHGNVLVQDPPVAQVLFQSTGLIAYVWAAVRLFVAYQWIEAGWEKMQNPAWMGPTGEGILTYWQRAVAIPSSGKPAISYDWYRGFLQFLIDSNAAPWFSKVIAFGEIAVGVAILLGAFVGIAAAAGLAMNMAYLLAGSASTNPILAMFAVFLILAWKNAGYVGLDRYLLPMLGTPWRQLSIADRPRPKLPAAA